MRGIESTHSGDIMLHQKACLTLVLAHGIGIMGGMC